jgi:DNA replication ATP-dependent helicase Dna2
MNAAINAFPSRAFYGGMLKPAPAVAQAALDITPTHHEQILDPTQPLIWVEVTPNSAALTKLNDAEARIAAELAKSCVVAGVAPADLGIIAPFRAQAAHIRQMITDLVKDGTTVDTADRFQGGERSVIILSLVATAAPVPDSQLGKFLSDARRLNVALTRARHKLVILGHRPAFASLPLLRDLALHCDEAEVMIEWNSYLE